MPAPLGFDAEVRIIGGSAAGRVMKVPKGFAVRPTPDLVKQAVFNSLGERVVGARVLELFAGTGALGLECLSRGALSVVAVERANRHAAVIRANLAETGLPTEAFEVRIQDVFAALAQLERNGRVFDLVVADPPFGEKNAGYRSESLSQQLLDTPEVRRVLAPTGLFILGHAKRDGLTVPGTWVELKVLRHGDSVMRFLAGAQAASSAA